MVYTSYDLRDFRKSAIHIQLLTYRLDKNRTFGSDAVGGKTWKKK
jgi:hypothetical protein